MKREAMTSRERWLSVLRRQTPDRVPTDYWTTDEAREKLKRHLRCADDGEIFSRLHIDRKILAEPDYVGPKIPENADVFGCRFQDMKYGTGKYRECVFHPLAQYASVAEIEKSYRWPSIDWFDCSTLKDRLKGWETQPVQGGGSEPFLTYADLRGQEQALMDLVINPEMVHYCLDRLYTLSFDKSRMLYETLPGMITHSFVAEDMGSQEDLIYSPEQIKEFFIPWMKKMIKLSHDADVFVFHHSDGAVRKIIPDMIKAGIDVLNPLQWRCKGMDREGLKRDFGSKLIFHGGVDNQQTLPFGTVADVRAEVLENLRIFGSGYILAPCHNIQAVSPAENVVALYQTVWEYEK
ncbi:MAG: uroporphyrinogen decarboxylase family protein [Spirochaetia bacterium]